MNIDIKAEDIEILVPQPTEAQPYEITGYPWGFRLRCNARYWVETTKNGQRCVFQTQDPRDGHWCTPKKSTYSGIVVLYKNKLNGHIENWGFDAAYADEADLAKFLAVFPEDKLSDYQKDRLQLYRAIYKTRKHITYTIVTNPTEAEQKRIDDNEAKAKELIPKLVSFSTKLVIWHYLFLLCPLTFLTLNHFKPLCFLHTLAMWRASFFFENPCLLVSPLP